MPSALPSRIHVSKLDGVARVVIDNPPVNVMDVGLMGERDLEALLRSLWTQIRD